MPVSFPEQREHLLDNQDEIDLVKSSTDPPQQQQPGNNQHTTTRTGSRRRYRKKSTLNYFRNKSGEPLKVDFVLVAKNNSNTGGSRQHAQDTPSSSISASVKKQGEVTDMRKRYFRNLKKKRLKISKPLLSQVHLTLIYYYYYRNTIHRSLLTSFNRS